MSAKKKKLLTDKPGNSVTFFDKTKYGAKSCPASYDGYPCRRPLGHEGPHDARLTILWSEPATWTTPGMEIER